MKTEVNPTTPAVPRKRGRPRTITDDQQVPERRRKQLRVAQQAYRKRKETTINNLQTRVQELEVGIEQLSESLLSFSNLLLEVNLPNTHPHIANALQDITQKCVSLARNGLDDSGPAPPSYTATTTTTERKTSPTQNVNSNIDSEVSRSDNSASPIENFLQFPCTELLQWSSNSLPPTPHYQESSILPLGILLSSPPMQFADVSLSPSSLPGTLTSGNLLQQDQAPLSHLLVRECCRNGFRLLVEMYDNDSRIKEIFGSPLPLPERNRLISGLYYALRDDAVDVVDVKSRVLMPLHAKMNVFTPGQTARLIKSWQFVLGSAPGVWLDASDVQRFVQEKGLLAQDMDSPSSTASYDSPTFNMAVFIRLLSLACICVGHGPAFRRQDVEKALYFATSKYPWTYEAPRDNFDFKS